MVICSRYEKYCIIGSILQSYKAITKGYIGVIGSIRVMKSGLFVLRLLEDFFFIGLSHIYFFGTFVELNFIWNMACGMGIRNIFFYRKGKHIFIDTEGLACKPPWLLTIYIYMTEIWFAKTKTNMIQIYGVKGLRSCTLEQDR